MEESAGLISSMGNDMLREYSFALQDAFMSVLGVAEEEVELISNLQALEHLNRLDEPTYPR